MPDTPDRFRLPESARTCCVCGTTGTLGQDWLVGRRDTSGLVWAHLGCAARADLQAIDQWMESEEW
jgi:hypothetical protein